MSEINFLPDDYLEKKAQRRVNTLCLTLFLLVTATVAAGVVVTEQRRRQIGRSAIDIGIQVEQAHKSLQQLDAVQARRKQVLDKAKASAALIEPLPQSLVLALLTNRLPDGAVVTSYKMKSKEIACPAGSNRVSNTAKLSGATTGACPPAAPPAPPKLQTIVELTGLASSDMQVAQYVQSLNDCRLIEQVNLPFSKEYDYQGITMRQFRITAQLRRDGQTNPADLDEARNLGVSAAGRKSALLCLLFGGNK